MRVFVTGGAGYIGSHTLVELIAAGHDVVVFDNLQNGHIEAVRRAGLVAGRKIEVIEGDVRDAAALDAAFRAARPDAVIHFAGLKAVGESGTIPLTYYDINVHGTIRLLEAMDAHGCSSIVFSSSATVYGDPEYLPLDEAHRTGPINPYGRTKLMVEHILQDWCATSDKRSAIVLRYFNPVGAHSSGLIGEDPRGIPNNLMPLIAQVAGGRRTHLDILGQDYDTRDGSGERDFIHVVDLARAHVAALDRMADCGHCETINIGTGHGTTVLELVAAFKEATGITIATRNAPRRPGDTDSCFACCQRANALLGWRAERDIAQMCHDTWAWQVQNPHGYGGDV